MSEANGPRLIQVEGVKGDRIGVVLVNAVKEQQAQIEAQQQQIELLKQKDATNQMEIMMFGT